MDTKKSFNKLNIVNFFIAAAGIFLRIFRLASVPIGVYVDEPPLAYNAWCIANYGVDRYLRPYPIYFQNWYSGQSPMYTYLLALLYKLGFKMGDVGVIRIPACVLSIGVMLLAWLISRELTEKKCLHTVTLAFAAFAPYLIMQGRIALDCNLLLFCVALSFLFLIKFCKFGKTKHLVICGICFGLSLYSYALSYILLGLFLVISALYMLWTKKITVKQVVLWALVVIVTGLPIILFAISVVFGIEEYRFLGLTIAPVSSGRMSELSGANFIKNAVLSVWASLSDDGQVALTLPESGTMYHLSIPFVITGMVISLVNCVRSFKKKEFSFGFLFLLLLVCNAIVGGLNQDVFVYRVNSIFVSYAYFFVISVSWIVSKIKKVNVRIVFASVLSVAYLTYTIVFAYYYLEKYNDIYPANLKLVGEEIEYAKKHFPDCDIYTCYLGLPEYILFEYPIDPAEWGQTENVGKIHSDLPDEITDFDKRVYIIPKTNAYDRERLNEYLGQIAVLHLPLVDIYEPLMWEE